MPSPRRESLATCSYSDLNSSCLAKIAHDQPTRLSTRHLSHAASLMPELLGQPNIIANFINASSAR